MSDDTLFLDIMLWVPKFLFLIVIAFILMAIVDSVHNQDVSSYKTELEVLTESMYISSDVFAYQDTYTKRVYPGVIDIDKFRKINLDDVISSPSKRFLVRVRLYQENILKGVKYYTSNRKSSFKSFHSRMVGEGLGRISEEYRWSVPIKIKEENGIETSGILEFNAYIET